MKRISTLGFDLRGQVGRTGRLPRAVTALLVSVALCMPAHAAASPDEVEVMPFIQSMYAVSISNFELANFNGRLNLRRHCQLLKQFFADALIKQPNISSGCALGEVGSVRYPSLETERLPDFNDTKAVPKAAVSEPRVSDSKATINVRTGNGRSVYFLEKVVDRWQRSHVLVYERWPSSDGLCMGSFLSVPSTKQMQTKPKTCKE